MSLCSVDRSSSGGRALCIIVLLSACGSTAPTSSPPPSPPAAVASVSISPDTGTLVSGATLQLTATVRDSARNVLSGRAITWTSDNPAISAVSVSGLVTAVAIGGPVHLTAASGSQSGVATVSVIPPATGAIGPQGGTVATPTGGATVMFSVGAIVGSLPVQVHDTQADAPPYPTLSSRAVELILPLTGSGAAFQANGTIEISIPTSRDVHAGAVAFVRARFKGVAGSYWAQATSTSSGRIVLDIPTAKVDDFRTILGQNVLDVVLDAEEFGWTPAGSIRHVPRNLFTSPLANILGGGDDGCQPLPASAAAMAPRFSACGGGFLQLLRPAFQGGTNSKVGIVLVHGWVPNVVTWVNYYGAQGINCIQDLGTLFLWACFNPGASPAPSVLPGQQYFTNLITALEAYSALGGPIYAFDYQSYNDYHTSGVELATSLSTERNVRGLEGFVVIGHSMGGLVARVAAQHLESNNAPRTVEGIITLATPHTGTPLGTPPPGLKAAIAAVFSPAIFTIGGQSLAVSLNRTEHTPLYLYSGNIDGDFTEHTWLDLIAYAAAHTTLCKDFQKCSSDGVVPSESSIPPAPAFSDAAVYRRDPLLSYDHTQMSSGRVPNDPLFAKVASDVTEILNRAGATEMVFLPMPTSAQAGLDLSPSVTVQLRDVLHRNIVGHQYQVTLALGSGPANATLGGIATTATDTNGTATFLGISVDRQGTYTLVASITSLRATSDPFIVSAAPQIATMKLTPQALSFSGVAQGSIPIAQTVAITNSGTGSLGTLAILAPNYQLGETQVQWLGAPSINLNTGIVTIQPNTTTLQPGTYHATVPVTATGTNVSNPGVGINVTYTVSSAALLAAPTLTAPANTLVGVSTTPTFAWSAVPGANRYWLMIAVSPAAFPSDPAASSCAACIMAGYTSATTHTLPNPFPNGASTGSPQAGSLNAGTTYYWQVQGFNNSVTPNTQGQYSATSSFTTAAPVGAPTMQLDRNAVPFSFTIGGSLPGLQVVNISNAGTGTLTGLSIGSVTYTAGQPTGWLSAALTNTVAPTAVSFVVIRSDLPQGVYTATIQVSSTAPGLIGGARTITVTLTVSPPAAAPTIALSAPTATFNATVGGGNPPTQNSIQVTNNGTGSLTGVAVGTVTYQSGQPTGWLVGSLTSSTAPSSVTLSALIGVLGPGSYTATVPITSTAPGVTNSPQSVTVTFVVSPGWTDVAPLPQAVGQPIVIAVNGLLYSIGGIAGSCCTEGNSAYNPGANQWTGLRALGIAGLCCGNGAAVIGNVIYTAGGQTGFGQVETLYAYDPVTDQWLGRALLPTPMSDGVSGAIGGKLYVLGGWTGPGGNAGTTTTKLFYVYDPAVDQWSQLPSPTYTHADAAGGVINGKFYVAGGFDETGAATNKVEVFDPVTNQWSARAAMPTASYTAAGTAASGRLYVIGGNDGRAIRAFVQRYDAATDTWTTLPSLPSPRAGAGAGVIGNTLYVVAGGNGSFYASVLALGLTGLP